LQKFAKLEELKKFLTMQDALHSRQANQNDEDHHEEGTSYRAVRQLADPVDPLRDLQLNHWFFEAADDEAQVC